ncbi:MAG: hypothetical protein K1X88_02090 [Nannocystaceae bacterium]|nr:hypothetical protein [Nannocystaceae bacterium]
MVAIAGALWLACAREPEGRFAQASETAPATPTGPFRYAETVTKAIEPGARAALLLELAVGSKGRLRAVVAVAKERPADPEEPVTVELWTFDQRNEAGVLEPTGEHIPLLRTSTRVPSRPSVSEFHRELATPGAEIHRELGVPGEDPQAVLATLADAAARTRAAGSDAATRVTALAEVFRGLDDGMLFERDALGTALEALATGRWRASAVTSSSERRASVTTSGGDTLELLRKGDGWVVSRAQPPAAPAAGSAPAG